MPILPRTGDIIILREVHSPAVYLLGALGGVPQLSYRTYAEAVEYATRFSREACVDVWYTIDAQSFDRVAQHRTAC
jgi:hypothetical protein